MNNYSQYTEAGLSIVTAPPALEKWWNNYREPTTPADRFLNPPAKTAPPAPPVEDCEKCAAKCRQVPMPGVPKTVPWQTYTKTGRTRPPRWYDTELRKRRDEPVYLIATKELAVLGLTEPSWVIREGDRCNTCKRKLRERRRAGSSATPLQNLEWGDEMYHHRALLRESTTRPFWAGEKRRTPRWAR